MNKDERHIARIIFKNKLLETDKEAFENLFTRVMQNYDSRFRPVKPQGVFGDRKNDGFIKEEGKYYQDYAPEDLSKNEKEALEKFAEDFNGLLEYWKKEGFNIEEYYFVINDKYKGAYPSIYSLAKNLEKKEKIKTFVFCCKDIEDIFMKLDDQDMLDIIGFIPDPLDISFPDYNVISEVIRHLQKAKTPTKPELIPENPDFEKKIIFNQLSKPYAAFLEVGRQQVFAVYDYFEFNSKYVKEEIRSIFQSLYNEAQSLITESNTKNDEMFQYIAEKATPRRIQAAFNSVYILMSYYFEFCDIFETPE